LPEIAPDKPIGLQMLPHHHLNELLKAWQKQPKRQS